MKKRGMAALLALVMLLSCLPGIAWAQEDAGGAGTLPSEEEAVYIRSAEDWTAYAKDHEDGTATKTTLVLAEDIDLGELSVFLGSTSKKAFTGTIYGNGHKISYTANADSAAAALILYAKNVTISGLQVDAKITATSGQCGAFISQVSSGTLTMTDCKATGSITFTGTPSSSGTGGLVGSCSAATMTNCTNEVKITFTSSSGKYVGGFIGKATNNLTLEKCINKGDIINSSASGSSAGAVGGLVGHVKGRYCKAITLTDCANSAAIQSPNTDNYYIGGLLGHMDGASRGKMAISDCFNIGTVSGTKGAGGLVGYSAMPTEITNSYNAGSVTTKNVKYGGGIAYKFNTSIQLTNVYNRGTLTPAQNNSLYCEAVGAETLNNCISLSGVANYITNNKAAAPANVRKMTEKELKSQTALTKLGDAFQAGPDGYPILKWEASGGDDIEAERTKAIEQLENTYTEASYYAPQWQKVSAALEQAKQELGAADSAATIVSVVNKWEEVLKQFPTKAQVDSNLQQEKTAVKARLESYVVPEDYSEAVQKALAEKRQDISTAVNAGKAAVDAVTAEAFAADDQAVTGAAESAFRTLDGIITACGAWDGKSTQEPTVKDGVYQIESAAQLVWFARHTDEDSRACALLLADIDLGQHDWLPMGSEEAPYAGTFDGNGKTISGLANSLFYAAGSGSAAACIRDLTISGLQETNWPEHGALVRYTRNAAIENCTSACRIVKRYKEYTGLHGGIVGKAEDGTLLIGCEFTGSITNGGYRAGGIAGVVSGPTSQIAYCRSTGTVAGSYYVGGIVGRVDAGAQVHHCDNSGAVSVNMSYVGGIAGWINGRYGTDDVSINPAIENCTNSGSVQITGSGSDYAGGIVGLLGYDTTSGNYKTAGIPTVSGCYSSGTVSSESGKARTGGIVGCFSQGLLENVYMLRGSAAGVIAELTTNATAAQTAGDCLILREKELNMDSHRLWMTEATEEKAACIQALWSDWQGDDQLMAYGTEQYALLREIFNRFMAQISDADGAESITLLDQQARAELAGVKTALAQARENALVQLRRQIDARLLTEESRQQAESLYTQAQAAIAAAKDETAVSLAQQEYSQKIGALQSYTDLALLELENQHNALLNEGAYTAENREKLENICQAACTAVRKAETAEAVDELVLTATADMKAVEKKAQPENDALPSGSGLSAETQTAYDALKNQYHWQDYREEQWQQVQNVFSALLSALTDGADVEESIAAARQALEEIPTDAQLYQQEKDDAAKALEAVRQSAFSQLDTRVEDAVKKPLAPAYLEQVRQRVKQAKADITKAEAGVDQLLAEAMTDIDGIFAAAAACAWNGAEVTEPAETDGVYQIGTAAELAWLSREVSGGNGGVKAVLTADIDLGGYPWTPIGSGAVPFAGSFDGAGHTVCGLSVDAEEYLGLLGYVQGGEVKNVTVQGDMRHTGNASYVGGIAGRVESGTILGCIADVSMTMQGGAGGTVQYVGGIAGFVNDTTVRQCANRGDIAADGAYVGGIAGYAGYKNVRIESCANHGDVAAINDSADYLGGILGGANGGTNISYKIEVTGCYNTGAVTGAAGKRTGGILGGEANDTMAAETLVVSCCYNAGPVQGNTYAGMLAGYSRRGTYATSLYAVKTGAADWAMGYPNLGGYSVAVVADGEMRQSEEILAQLNGQNAGFAAGLAPVNDGYPFLSFELLDGTWREQLCRSVESILKRDDFTQKQWKQVQATTDRACSAILDAETTEAIRSAYLDAVQELEAVLPNLRQSARKELAAAAEQYPESIRAEVTGLLADANEAISAAENGCAVAEAADRFYAAVADAAIAAIGTVTKDSKAAITAARTLYDGLTDAQQTLCARYFDLLAAELAYDKIVNTPSQPSQPSQPTQADTAADSKSGRNGETASAAADNGADRQAASAVEKLIDAIGTVTADRQDAVAQAQKAYDALTDEQKAMVKNYSVLENAQKILSELNRQVQQPDQPEDTRQDVAAPLKTAAGTSHTGLIAAICVAAALVIGGVIWMVLSGKKRKEK